MPFRYITHARSAAELRAEFVSDIQRRLDTLDNYLSTMKPSATEASRISRARLELLSLLDFWKNLELIPTEEQKL